jgi:hypothetical protein
MLLDSLPKQDSWVIYWIDEPTQTAFTVRDLKTLVETINGQ